MKMVTIVDDNSAMLRMVEKMLPPAEFTCASFSDGQAAIAHLAINHADLLITDIYMPGIEGVELIRSVRTTLRTLPIIAMSGGGRLGENILDIIRHLGADAVLDKPFTQADLLAAMAEAQSQADERAGKSNLTKGV